MAYTKQYQQLTNEELWIKFLSLYTSYNSQLPRVIRSKAIKRAYGNFIIEALRNINNVTWVFDSPNRMRFAADVLCDTLLQNTKYEPDAIQAVLRKMLSVVDELLLREGV